VVIVGIDVKTLETSLYGRFPFARVWDARMIDRLREDGAKTIAYDLVFDSASDPKDDLALYDAAARAHGHLVLAATASATHGSGATLVLGGAAHHQDARTRAGS